MDIGKSITYIFQDKRWFTKLILGWLINLVPILNFAFSGYVTQTIRNVETNMEEPLPEWDDFGRKFTIGFYLWVAGIVYALPIILLSFIFVVPVFFATGEGETSDLVSSLFIGSSLLFTCFTLVYVLVLSLFMPAMNINLARKSTFGAAFEIKEFFRIFRNDTGAYLTAWIMSLVWAIVIFVVVGVVNALLSWVICIGWIVGFVVAALAGVAIPLVYAHLFGQVAAKDMGAE